MHPNNSHSASGDDVPGERLQRSLSKYYKFHAPIYDWTRWTFLFGRNDLLQQISLLEPQRILEIGCGTGSNLVRLAKALPRASIVGVDLSDAMLAKARQKTRRYSGISLASSMDGLLRSSAKFDVVLLSYVLSMCGDTKEVVLANACQSITPGGHLAVVDFDDSHLDWFVRWMKRNHVDLDGSVMDALEAKVGQSVRSKEAYLGVWRYLHLLHRI
jgi:S-adenosylmethionine-diacylgycerolhomoserine-N-methlytransferase